MRTKSTGGFTLIELLIVIAIIGILAAVLIPNLLNARARAFDTAAQTCLRELGTQMEVVASNSPFEYSDTGWTVGGSDAGGVTIGAGDDAQTIASCEDVVVTVSVGANGGSYTITGEHLRGSTNYTVQNGTGVAPTP